MSCILVDFDSKAKWIINHDFSINTCTCIKYIGTELVACDCLPVGTMKEKTIRIHCLLSVTPVLSVRVI